MNTTNHGPIAVVEGRLGSATIVLLTITDEEFRIIQRAFSLTQNIEATPYFVKDASSHVHEVALVKASAQTNAVAEETAGGSIEDFRPAFMLLIGTAGGHSGRDNVALGDVVVANYIQHVSYMKLTNGKTHLRKIAHDHPSLYLIEKFVEPLRWCPERWQNAVTQTRPEIGSTKMLTGEIICGDKLYGDPNNVEQKTILEMFDKALAVEMEGWGVARAMYKARQHIYYNPQFLVIRGVSDLVDQDPEENHATRKLWTAYAVECATAVAMRLVAMVLDAVHKNRAAFLAAKN